MLTDTLTYKISSVFGVLCSIFGIPFAYWLFTEGPSLPLLVLVFFPYLILSAISLLIIIPLPYFDEKRVLKEVTKKSNLMLILMVIPFVLYIINVIFLSILFYFMFGWIALLPCILLLYGICLLIVKYFRNRNAKEL